MPEGRKGHAPVQILGAGLTGLSAAHSLGAEAEIHERLAWVGGHAITVEEEGYRFDRTGHLLHLRNPEIRTWIEGLLGGERVEVQRRSMVFSHGAYTRYPYQANTYGLPPQVAYECLMGLLEAERIKADVPEPSNFEEFCLKHFGKGFSEHFMLPYNEKLWGVHPREITAEWCSRFVPMPKLEDVIAGAVGLNDRELGYNTNFLYPRRGIGQLPEAIAASLNTPIHYEHAPLSIDAERRTLRFEDGEVAYQALISTAPLKRLLHSMENLPDAIGQAADKLRCNALWYLDVALESPCLQEGLHWAYVPEARFPFYRVGCYSNFSADMAPPGKACLYVELSSRDEPDMNTLLPEVARGLAEMRIVARPEDIRFARARCIEHAYVVYDHHYYEALDTVRPFLDAHRIVSAGRYGAWNYSSMEDALLFGRDAARRAQEWLA